jgi:hypothetical protein
MRYIMKNILFIITAVMVTFFGNSHYSHAAPLSVASSSQSTQQDQRLQTLQELFELLGAKVEPNYPAMNAYAQEHWLRKAGQERWQMEMSAHQAKMKQIIAKLTKLGMIDRIDPTVANPDYAVVLGATTYRIRTRMQNMLELISAGKFMPKQIVVLTGERPLDPKFEPTDLLASRHAVRKDWIAPKTTPTNETEAAKFIWDQLEKPDSIKNIPIVFVSTPMLEKDGKPARPTTVDTLESWLKVSPKPGSIVAFSNNPYVAYQNETMKPTLIKAGWFKQGGTLETVGYAFSEKEDNDNVANLLDNVARYIYSILQVEKTIVETK